MVRLTFDASDKGDLLTLASRMNGLTLPYKAMFAAMTLDAGLMRTRWWLHAFVWVLSKCARCTKVIAWATLFLRLNKMGHKDIVENAITDTIVHMLDGKDKIDRRSVGGFCQDELDKLVGLLVIAEGFGPERRVWLANRLQQGGLPASPGTLLAKMASEFGGWN